MQGSSFRPSPLTSDLGSSSWPFLCRCSLALLATAPDLGRGVTPLGCRIYVCFIDYAKAFDCVDHDQLWKILKDMGIPDHLISS